MIFAFTGFSQDGDYRIFKYERLPRDPQSRTFHVKADMALARSHKIPLQELPMLCRAFLENQSEEARGEMATFSAANMLDYAKARDNAQEGRKARKPYPQRPAAAAGSGY